MHYQICFSIPCHEAEDCVEDLCLNILRLAPNSAVVLHVNLNSGEDFYQKINLLAKKYSHVYINDARLPVQWGNGMLLNAYIYNYLYALSNNISFDYYWMDASNSLIVNPMIEAVVKSFDYGIVAIEQKLDTNWCWTPMIQSDSELIKIAEKCDKNNPRIFGGPIEGAFFKKELFDIIFEHLKDCIWLKPGNYPREETYIHTVVGNLSNVFVESRRGSSMCLRGYDQQTLERIAKQDFEDLKRTNIMTLKPIPREYDNPIRDFIRRAVK